MKRAIPSVLYLTLISACGTGAGQDGIDSYPSTGGAPGTAPISPAPTATGTGTPPIGTASGQVPPGTGGAAPMTPVPASVGDAGTLPFAGYDPTVSFDWPQGVTASTASCKAGHYKGSFVGIYSPSIAVAPVPIPVAGDIDLTLTKSQSGEFFEITGGKVSGVADLLFPFSADVKGTLNCATMTLENGFLSNGTYIVGVFPYPFEGPLTASYDKLTHAFTGGKWTVGEPKWTTPAALYGGSGTWQANWVGP
jgi:hypothetical protein